MGVIRPRPPASQNLASDRAANLADRQQMRRLLSQQRTPRPAAPGAVTTTEAVGAYAYAGGGQLLYSGWTFDSQPYGGGGDGPALSDSGNSIEMGADGWYQFGWKQTIQFPASGGYPTTCQAELNNSRLLGIPDPFFTVILSSTHPGLPGASGAVIDYTSRWLWCEAGDLMTPKLFWTGSGDPTALSNYGIHLYVSVLA